MAINSRDTDCPPAVVWTALADGFCYADWVVGTSQIRDVDAAFPAPGARIHYTIGRGPFRHEGHTDVISVERGHRIHLEAHAWPLGAAKIELTVEALGDGSRIHIEEHPSQGLGRRLHNPLIDLFIKARNVETLRRLERVAATKQQTSTVNSAL